MSTEELEIIGQLRLFDDAMPLEGARVPVELDGGGPQLKLF
ncbi:hypothetical protein [Burkholderia gladioli]|nr:hypothetical protein [Burkholderia gladioli]